MVELIVLDIVDDAFIVQNQNLSLQISKRATFFCDMSTLMYFKKNILDKTLKHLWYKAFSEFADQHYFTQSITETELHALTDMEGKSPSQQKKGQAV